MRRLTVLLLPLVLTACGNEVAPVAGGSTPRYSSSLRGLAPSEGQVSPHMKTPPQSEPAAWPTRLPSRPPLPRSAYQRLTVTRLAAPDATIRAPAAGHAQVVLACGYEEWSRQYEFNVRSNQNPPGRHLRGERGDFLDSRTVSVIGRALGNPDDVLADDYFARSYTEDSWPDRKLVSAFEVRRSSLTRQNVLTARNEFAVGCSAMHVPPLLEAVRVSVYAPWDWKL